MKLNQYRVVGKVCIISGGLVKLSDEQFKLRAHNLLALEDHANIFEIVNRIQFKNGEVFGHDGDLRKVPSVESVVCDYKSLSGKKLQDEFESRDLGSSLGLSGKEMLAAIEADDANDPNRKPIIETDDYQWLKGSRLVAALNDRGIEYDKKALADDKRGLLMVDDAKKKAAAEAEATESKPGDKDGVTAPINPLNTADYEPLSDDDLDAELIKRDIEWPLDMAAADKRGLLIDDDTAKAAK